MNLNRPRVQNCLKACDLETLFVEELGWDRPSGDMLVDIDDKKIVLRGVAQKRGVQILAFHADEGHMPDYATRQKIERQVAKLAREHLIIFVNADKTEQRWQWVARVSGQPTAYREYPYYSGQSGEALIQKLGIIYFTLDEEEGLDLLGTVIKLRDAFDRDRVTKKFYDHFKTEHATFLKFIKGIDEQTDQTWYASLMLNRLMFVYFIQKKGFLDGDPNYLKNRLKQVQQQKGKGKFHSFYQHFLIRLFHEGFGQQPAQRASDLDLLLGKVPYLNGGLFDPHELEIKHQQIDIPDEAFEKLFAFFDQYEWHLDTRPLKDDQEINPDVLGYIFEKYINQKQMGAYYTKEDITEYISKNTVIPYLFDAAQKQCAVAFQPDAALWRLLREDADRYIYPAVRKGVDVPLPNDIAAGIGNVKKREGWNRAANPDVALPTETWREFVARRQRCLDVREKLEKGEIVSINDLITYNLDIRQFAEDAISQCEGPELLRAFYQAISTVTVLDPTCGSGAFLFAALNILEPLYETCLNRMQGFVDDLELLGERHRPEKFSDFRKILANVARHPNRQYFILKSIIVNNLYGVDIMDEAVEICKLRLFLKLVAQVENVGQLEPLPDVDFNIRSGNTLVGFVSVEEIRRAAAENTQGQVQLVFGETNRAIKQIEEDAEVVERAFQKFHDMQTAYGMDAQDFSSAKRELRDRLKMLAQKLDCYLAKEYGIDLNKKTAYEKWRTSHQPFHWFAEFYGIMRKGGFDVVIGNPPYVESKKIAGQYSFQRLALADTGNLFSVSSGRFVNLTQKSGYIGVILPISSVSTPRMLSLMVFLTENLKPLYISNFSVRPGKLFVGVDMNLSIILGQKSLILDPQIYTTAYNRWHSEFRSSLFPNLTYIDSELEFELSCIPKWKTNIEKAIANKLKEYPKFKDIVSKSNEKIFYHSGGRYFRKCLRNQLSNEYKELSLPRGWGDGALCLLSSSLYYWLWICLSDTYHVTKRDLDFVPVAQTLQNDNKINRLSEILLNDLWKNSVTRVRKRADGTRQEEVNFYVGMSKPITDQIDEYLGKHYKLTDEELDFIINYDIKYRMGQEDDA